MRRHGLRAVHPPRGPGRRTGGHALVWRKRDRGREFGGKYYLYEEDGSLLGPEIRITTGSGVVYDGDGRPVNRVEPDASVIIELMRGPELTHKGVWLGWFAGVIFCAATAASILFADELFRWNMSFSIRNADRAEPSDWEIMSRYIMWTVLPIVAMFMFIMGLK